MAIGDVYKLTDLQSNLSQVCLNVYFYRQTTAEDVSGALDLANAFRLQVLPSLVAIQGNQARHDRLEVFNLTDQFEIASLELTANNVGTRSGAMMPSYVAYGFKLLRGSLLTRHGSKRITGAVEEDISQNFVISGALTLLQGLATAMENTITAGVGFADFEPVIVRRPLPTTPGNPVYSVVTGAQYTYVTSQNTRKWFRPGI